LGFSGVVVIFSDQFSGEITDYLIGMFAIILSAMMQAGIVVTIKKFGNHLHPLSMNLIPMFIAGLSMLIIGIAFENYSKNTLQLSGVLSILYLAFFGSLLTFTSYYWLLKKINIIILSFTAFITPITALVLGYIIYNEELSPGDFIGSALVLFGVFAANIGNLRKMRKTPVFKPDG
jgi:drug/metabolite transporter (DMT)-like permease